MPKRPDRPDNPERPARPARALRAVPARTPPAADAPALVRQLAVLCTALGEALDTLNRAVSLLIDHAELRNEYDALKDKHDALDDDYEDLKQELEALTEDHRDLQTRYQEACSMLIVERRKQAG